MSYAPLYGHTMITTAGFKKQIAKPFGQEMRRHGFKGTGFEYKQETDDYLIAIYIDPSRWGGSCSAGFALHPKLIDKDYNGKKDLTKLKTYQYEFKFGLTPFARGEHWEYSDDEFTNLVTLSKIVEAIKAKAFPVIYQFKTTPNVLDQFEVSEMNEFHDNLTKRLGTSIATTDLRFAWAMTIIFENKNLEKARQFAKWALSQTEGQLKELSKLIYNWNLINVASKSQLDNFSKKLLNALLKEKNVEKISRIIESELCVTFGLYSNEFDSNILAEQIMQWQDK